MVFIRLQDHYAFFWVQVAAVAALMERARRRQSKRFDVVAFGDMLTAALEAPNPPEAGLEVLATEYAAYADVRYAACRARRQYALLLENWLRQQCRVCARLLVLVHSAVFMLP